MNCVYCKNKIIQGQNYSEEHIFPESFSCPRELIIDCVCRDCNNRLGGTIDRYLAFDSFEGDKRWRVQTKKYKKDLNHYKRLERIVPYEKQFGDYQGVNVAIDLADPGNYTIPSQIGFQDQRGMYRFKTLEELKNVDIEKQLEGLFRKKFKLFYPNREKRQELLDFIVQHKIVKPSFKIESEQFGLPLENGKLPIQMSAIINSEILRSIAKISFNYLAKVKGWDYLIKSQFDDIRTYIKDGKNLKKINFVIPNVPHILYKETKIIKFLDGFIIVVELTNSYWTSKVSLFNDLTYQVNLSRDSGLIWHPFRSGIAYDYKNKKVMKVGGVSKNFL